MSARRKILVAFFIVPVIFLFSSKLSFAQVVINEVSSGTTSDWVEIFNKGEPKEVSSLKLVDNAGNEISFPSCLLNTSGTYSLNWSNRLDNAGDKISLIEGSTTIDCVSYGSGPACEGRGIDLPAMTGSEFGAREPEGIGGWVKKTSSTKSDNSYCAVVTPTPTPTIVPSPTPTPTSSQPKAIYKINEVKDKDGNVLSSVKVYLDGVYLHHYAPETLTFCDGCKCDTYVDCGFGEHTVELQKTGYEDWEERKNFTVGDSFEANPVMKVSSTDSPANPSLTPIPTSKPLTPTPTRKMTPTPEATGLVATESGEILGEESSPAAFYPLEQTPTSTFEPSASSPGSQLLPKIFIVLGLVVLFGVAFWLWYTRFR